MHSPKRKTSTMRAVAIAFLVILFLNFDSSAQTGTVRGNVYEAETGVPIIYCNLRIEGTLLGGTTDLDGFFVIPNIPVG
ncbi:MAG: hypothetical protein WBO36_10955, partial [Saprospiraceae bacterium]